MRRSANKYHNVRVACDGYIFASKRELQRYQELKLLVYAGQIRDLQLQPAFSLDVNGVHVANYIGDFAYTELGTGAYVVEDVKSTATRTAVYRLKKRLVKALYHLEVREV